MRESTNQGALLFKKNLKGPRKSKADKFGTQLASEMFSATAKQVARAIRWVPQATGLLFGNSFANESIIPALAWQTTFKVFVLLGKSRRALPKEPFFTPKGV